MYEIVPGVLEKDWESVKAKLSIISQFARSAHIDFIDGKFVENKTFMEFAPFKEFSTTLILEAHLMVEEPLQYLQPLADAGFRRFLGHVEKMSDQTEFVAEGQLLGEVGLALDGPTPLSAITVPYDDLDCLHFYISEKVGYAGPPMKPERLEKLKEARQKTQIPFEVDGGIKDTTILQAIQAGATRCVATSFITGSDNPKEQFLKLRNLLPQNQ